MIRTQIQLTEEQARRLKQIAAAEGRSMADIVRESVGEYLATLDDKARDKELKWRFLEAAGRFESGITDLGENHDKYLEDVYADYKK